MKPKTPMDTPSTGDDVYCIGGLGLATTASTGLANAVYYSSISSQPPPTSELTVDTLGQNGTPISPSLAPIAGAEFLLYDSSGNLLATGFSPVTFTVNTGQAYTVQAEGYGSCQFSYWASGSGTSGAFGSRGNSTIFSVGGNVTITAVYSPTASALYGSTTQVPCGPTPSLVTIESVNQTGQAISRYLALYNASGSLVGVGFPPNSKFQTTAGQTYSVQADSYDCTFSQWSDGVTSNPRTFVATNGDLSFTAVYDCVTTGEITSTVDVSTINSAGSSIAGY
jgi:hypothetical protein